MRTFRSFAVGFVALALFVGTTAPVHAALTESQIQSIIGLLSSFGADQSAINNVNISLRGGTPSVTSPNFPRPNDDESQGSIRSLICPIFNSTLSRGMRGEEVRSLQEFLTDNLGLSEDIATGYYGVKTEQYVRKFQAQNGVEQVGYVGRLTRAQIARACSGTTISPSTMPGVVFSASPTSGHAPLSVRFTSSLYATHDASEPQYYVDFGDGSERGRITCLSSTGSDLGTWRCLQWGVDHVYSSNGTYTSKLVRIYNGVTITLNTATITVGGTTNASITVTSPNGGEIWRMGEQHKIIWKGDPFIVSTFLEKLVNGQFVTEGIVVQEGDTEANMAKWSGKVSGVTASDTRVPWHPESGYYYIRVSDIRTGTVDRSDAPFSFVTTPTPTVTLTTSQINAMISLLTSFGASQTTINRANIALTGGIVSMSTSPSGLTDSQVNAALSLASAFGASQSISMNLKNALTPTTITSSFSPWGQKLGVQNSNIPESGFRTYVFNRDSSGNPTTLTRPSIVIDEPYLNYSNLTGGYGATLDNQIGAYFVGKSTYGNPSPPITFDFSNPQWDTARLYIDGQLVHTYGGNSGSPTYTRTFQGGTHIFEIEYDGLWGSGTFALRIGRIVTPPDYVAAESILNVLQTIEAQYGTVKVFAASVYESADDVNGDVKLNLPILTSPTVLVLSSYDPVRWRWTQISSNLNQVKAIIVYSFAGAAMPDLYISTPVYRVRNVYIGDGDTGSMTAGLVSAQIGHAVDSFVTEYSPTALTFPISN